jgi:hypothetical protein
MQTRRPPFLSGVWSSVSQYDHVFRAYFVYTMRHITWRLHPESYPLSEIRMSSASIRRRKDPSFGIDCHMSRTFALTKEKITMTPLQPNRPNNKLTAKLNERRSCLLPPHSAILPCWPAATGRSG